MTATNHALTGALIGLSSGNPSLAVPAALVSHFICDALPHFGAGKKSINQTWFSYLLAAEAGICFLIVAVLFLLKPEHWLLGAVCAFVATSPDFMWVKSYLHAKQGLGPVKHTSAVLRFHAWIQWFERPIGIVFEVAWAVLALILLKVYIV